MKDESKNPDIVKPVTDAIASAHKFSDEAMATTFEILICHPDKFYAGQAARAAFAELDRLESQLSRFIENSDISRINDASANQPVKVGLDALECLNRCIEISSQTNGAFDITVGPLLDCWLDEDKNLLSPSQDQIDRAKEPIGCNLLKLNLSDFTVTLTDSAVKIDLGGFGKGYAVEKMAQLLKDWDINPAFISAGSSSVFALDPPPDTKGWPVTITSLSTNKQLELLHMASSALSGSALTYGQHIIDPRSAQPVSDKLAAWSLTKDPALADALSTAFMVMSSDEIKTYCQNHPDTSAIIEMKNAKVLRYDYR